MGGEISARLAVARQKANERKPNAHMTLETHTVPVLLILCSCITGYWKVMKGHG